MSDSDTKYFNKKEGENMKKFSLNDILNDKSKEKKKRNDFTIEYIHISKLIPDENNFYSVDDVAELKDSILLLGLQQPLIVRKIEETDTYTVSVGHRRLKALTEIVDEGNKEFELIPCKVETEIDEIKNELRLIFTNSTTRVLSDYEKTHQAMRIKELLTALKQKGVKLPGRLRDIIADTMKISKTQVARMESIDNNLSNKFKEEFKNNNVNFSTAYEISGLQEEQQEEALKDYKEKGSITIKEVKDIKKKKPSPETVQTIVKTTITEEVTQKEPEQLTPDRVLNVYVCCAYAGEDEDYQRAATYCKHVAAQGHIPFSSTVMLHGILDGGHYERMLNMLQAGFEMIKIVDAVWIFEKDGEITQDMLHQKELAKQLGKEILHIGGIC